MKKFLFLLACLFFIGSSQAQNFKADDINIDYEKFVLTQWVDPSGP